MVIYFRHAFCVMNNNSIMAQWLTDVCLGLATIETSHSANIKRCPQILWHESQHLSTTLCKINTTTCQSERGWQKVILRT